MNPGQGCRFFFVPNIVTTAFYGIKFEEFFFFRKNLGNNRERLPAERRNKGQEHWMMEKLILIWQPPWVLQALGQARNDIINL